MHACVQECRADIATQREKNSFQSLHDESVELVNHIVDKMTKSGLFTAEEAKIIRPILILNLMNLAQLQILRMIFLKPLNFSLILTD